MTAVAKRSGRGRWFSTIVFVVALVGVTIVFRAELSAWFTGKSLGGAVGAAVTAHAGPYSLDASLDPDPPGTQANALVLEVRDASGKPVDDAKVAVLYDMPAMGAMAEMKGNAKVEHRSGGRYRAEFDLPMAGTFALETTVTAPGGSASQNFSITVGNRGLTVAGGSTNADARRQLIGVRTGKVIEGPLSRSFRAVGHVTYDESALTDVNLKVHGWITKLFVNRTGQHVGKGQPLFQFYSPELYSAEQDFLLATRDGTSAATAGAPPSRVELLGRAARQRLHLLDLTDAQIDALEKSGTPSENSAVPSPASGFVIEKNVVEGASVEPGTRLYRIAALNEVWVEAEVYEADLAHVHVGQAAEVTLDYLPQHSYAAKVSYVYPYLDPTARTGRIRVALQNKELELKPGMYASVELASAAEPRVQVPAAAVVYTGPRRLVFVDLGEGRFKPQEVRVGTESNGMYEVLSGLKPGDTVATSGIFLLAAEARLGTAAKYWDEAPETPESEDTPADASSSAAPTPSSTAPSRATVYSCPMHPDVKSSTPGKCPKCGMTLEPVPSGGSR